MPNTLALDTKDPAPVAVSVSGQSIVRIPPPITNAHQATVTAETKEHSLCPESRHKGRHKGTHRARCVAHARRSGRIDEKSDVLQLYNTVAVLYHCSVPKDVPTELWGQRDICLARHAADKNGVEGGVLFSGWR